LWLQSPYHCQQVLTASIAETEIQQDDIRVFFSPVVEQPFRAGATVSLRNLVTSGAETTSPAPPEARFVLYDEHTKLTHDAIASPFPKYEPLARWCYFYAIKAR
jgi:hypothetical protein